MKRSALAFLLTTASASILTYPVQSEHHAAKGATMLENLDVDKDGAITKDEIRARQTLGFAEADANSDGVLSYQEFEARALARQARRAAKRHQRKFSRLDSDGDGLISEAEHSDWRTARMEKRFKRIDTNKDGEISANERQAAINRMPNARRGPYHGE